MGAMKTILNLVNFATLTEKEKAQLLEVFQNRKREIDKELKSIEKALGKKGKGQTKRKPKA